MLTIDIDRVTTRYRLPAKAAGERPRLQRVIDDALRRVLEAELEQQGIDPAAYVCVDAVHTVVPLRLGQEDGTLADVAGHAIARAIQGALQDGSASVVRFSSRAHLLADAAASALAGDFSRSWAWTQAGVWRSDGALRADAAANHVLRMLANEAVYAVGVLRYLSRAYPDRLRTLLTSATPRTWELLASAVLSTACGGHRLSRLPEHTIGSGTDVTSRSRVTAIATRVAAESLLARAALAQWAALPRPLRRSILVIAVLEIEPSAARHAADIVEALTAIGARHDTQTERDHDAGPPDDSRPQSAAGAERRPTDSPAAERSTIAQAGHHDRSDQHQDRGGTGTQGPAPAIGADHGAAPEPPVDVRTRVSTRYGGVLYLIHLLPQTGVIEAIDRDEQWASRGMRWVLHQLAMQLAGLEPDDPAALVCAGLQPDAPPPSALQDPASDAERAALAVMAHQIATALRHRLGREEPVDAAIADVFARPAAIVAEPGWIEARFALDDVSIEIRRAGLDIDPDWVPWLGIVLRFVYE